MKKYFMKGTDDELQFGDMIELTCSKNFKDGTIRKEKVECKFLPPIVPLLLEEGIIEEKNTKEPEEEICPMDIIAKDYIDLSIKVDKLEAQVSKLNNIISKKFPKSYKNAERG